MHGRQRFGPMSNCSSLPVIAWTTDRPWTACRLGVILLLAADALLASGQMIRRPVQVSGSTSVVLIARVESLSVVASAEMSSAAGGPAAVPPLSITTSWAVPANFTTFRLSEYFARPSAISAVPQAAGPGAVEAQAPLTVEGGDVLVVESGQTNDARTRTDRLDPGANPSASGESGAEEETGLNILVQAL